MLNKLQTEILEKTDEKREKSRLAARRILGILFDMPR